MGNPRHMRSSTWSPVAHVMQLHRFLIVLGGPRSASPPPVPSLRFSGGPWSASPPAVAWSADHHRGLLDSSQGTHDHTPPHHSPQHSTICTPHHLSLSSRRNSEVLECCESTSTFNSAKTHRSVHCTPVCSLCSSGTEDDMSTPFFCGGPRSASSPSVVFSRGATATPRHTVISLTAPICGEL